MTAAGSFSSAVGRGEDVDPYWSEVRQLMSSATAEEAALSSDEEGAVDRLIAGCTLGWERHRWQSTSPPPLPQRRESAPTAGGRGFQDRMSAAFRSLQPGGVAAPAAGVVGPAFSRQCEGHRLEEGGGTRWDGLGVQDRLFALSQFEESEASQPQQGAAGLAAANGMYDDEDDITGIDHGGGGGHGGDGGDGGDDDAEEEDDEDMAEWCSKTATWAQTAGSSDEEEEKDAAGGIGGRGGFGGIDDLDALDDGGGAQAPIADDGMETDSPKGSLAAAAAAAAAATPKRSPASTLGGVVKRVRLVESEGNGSGRACDGWGGSGGSCGVGGAGGRGSPSGEERPIGLAASDPALRQLLRARAPAGTNRPTHSRRQPQNTGSVAGGQSEPPASASTALSAQLGGSGGCGSSAGGGDRRRGYVHYSLDDVDESVMGEAANRHALAALQQALGVPQLDPSTTSSSPRGGEDPPSARPPAADGAPSLTYRPGQRGASRAAPAAGHESLRPPPSVVLDHLTSEESELGIGSGDASPTFQSRPRGARRFRKPTGSEEEPMATSQLDLLD